jgi:hypothetical protein
METKTLYILPRNTMKYVIYFSLLFIFAEISNAGSGPTWVSGTMMDITSVPEGLLIKVDGGSLPNNCTGASAGWMKIPEANKTMTLLL